MPFLAIALLLLLPLVVIALLPLILIQRYRAGSARRLARPWVATLNLVAMIVSAAFFLIAAAVTNVWVPGAFRSAAIGLAIQTASDQPPHRSRCAPEPPAGRLVCGICGPPRKPADPYRPNRSDERMSVPCPEASTLITTVAQTRAGRPGRSSGGL